MAGNRHSCAVKRPARLYNSATQQPIYSGNRGGRGTVEVDGEAEPQRGAGRRGAGVGRGDEDDLPRGWG